MWMGKHTDHTTHKTQNSISINMTRKKMCASDFATRLSVNQTMVFYMDEVGLNLSMRRAYGYSPSGLKT